MIMPWLKLKIIKTYNIWRAIRTHVPIDDWTLNTKEMFDDFQLFSDYQPSPYHPSQITSSTRTINATPAYVRPKDLVNEFRKGFKRDPSLFAVHKDVNQ
jgi:hypothetical protein